MEANQIGNAAEAARLPEDMGALVNCALIMLVAAVIGGLAAYLTRDRTAPEENAKDAFWRFILLGIIASACVPLFLSLVRSGIMTSILTNAGGNRLESYLAFGGLCALAAYSGRSFITSISQRVLQQVAEVRNEVRQIEQKADDAQATATDAKQTAQDIATEVEDVDTTSDPTPEIMADRKSALKSEAVPSPVTADERRVLEALAMKTYRTRTGVAEDSGVQINRISEVLDDLASRKLVLETKSPTTKGRRWAISKRGAHALAGASQP